MFPMGVVMVLTRCLIDRSSKVSLGGSVRRHDPRRRLRRPLRYDGWLFDGCCWEQDGVWML